MDVNLEETYPKLPQNFSESLSLAKMDYSRYFKNKPTLFRMLLGCLQMPNFAFLFWFRLSASKGIHSHFCKLIKHFYAIRCSYEIPSCTRVGGGLHLGHYCGIIIHPTAIIGQNVSLSQFTTIGRNIGSNNSNAAIIGDNVYMGASVCTVGNVKIGNGAKIGAGAVVAKDIPENATAVGVPAKVVKVNGGSTVL